MPIKWLTSVLPAGGAAAGTVHAEVGCARSDLHKTMKILIRSQVSAVSSFDSFCGQQLR